MSRARKTHRKHRVIGIGLVGAGLIAGGLATAGAFAGESGSAAGGASAQTISCPSADGKLPEIPAGAQDEVERNLAQLDKQLAEANDRLARSRGEGGPNFVQNAILGPLEDKRTAALNRIETAIGRLAEKPEGLEALATCALGGQAAAGEAAPPAEGAGGDGEEQGAAAGAPTVDCADVASQLGAVPAEAQARIDRELAQLRNQIDEANGRLARSQGEGGPNFVQNAILGPLEGKRRAVIDRIGQAVERGGGQPPAGLGGLASCGLNEQ
ncbi:hypothetical protein [Streptomyces albus]|uniref:hypothetical protein n=1 Tax=Streptomyces albus TaxID=1888 RepID=UPI0004C780FC|nr:hypothetical protein [Streptomyces albus]